VGPVVYLGSGIAGLTWDLGSVVLYRPGEIHPEVFVVYVVAGVAAGAVAGLSVWLPAFVAFIAPHLLGLIGVLAYQGDLHYVVMAAMAAAMLVFLIWLAMNFNRTVRPSLRLDLENLQLTRQLDRARSAESLTQSKSQFFAAINHELRTPLNAIIGFSEMLKSEALRPLGNDKHREYTEDIHCSARSLLGQVDKILMLSKIDFDAVAPERRRVDLVNAVKEVTIMVQENATAGGLRILSDVADDCRWLQCDDRLLRQMLLILLSHDVKFTPRDGVITLRVSRANDGGCTLSVLDEGPATPELDLRKLMADFGDADSYLANVRYGAAYSFSLVKSLAEIQGARFDVKDAGGRGTMVGVTFPAESFRMA